VDGVEYGPFENLWLTTSAAVKPSLVYLSLFNHDSTHSAEGIMVDDVVVATAAVGPRRATGVQRQASGHGLQEFNVCQLRNGRIVFSSGPGLCELFVHDISGRLLWTHVFAFVAGKEDWLAPALLPGVYLASLRYNGKTIVQKEAVVR
jgi:hypothetical protein